MRGSLGNGHRWVAVFAGLLLLVANTTVGGESSVDDTPAPVTRVEEPLETKLLRVNPRLGDAKSRRIADAVRRCSDTQGIEPELLLAVIVVESSARPHARSPKGAVGLMQVMPYMYRELGLPGSAAHLEANIEAGCLLLADNIRRLGLEDGISTYFWGRRIRGDGYLRRVKGVLEDLAVDESPTPVPRRG